MDKLNQWAVENLGTWTLEYFGLFVILTAALAVLLILVLLIVLVRHIKIKQKIKKLKAEAAAARSDAPSDGIDEAALRAEIEQSVRAEIAQEQGVGDDELTQSLRAQVAELSMREEQLNDSLREKQNRIDELTVALENNGGKTNDNADLYRTINELDQRVKEQENELNILRAENSQIKAQAMQKQLAEQSAARTPRQSAEQAAEARKTTRTAAKPVEVDETPDDEDEYDEYYDDYGDESSAVKVTLKFDRVKNNWIILRSDTDRTYRRMATKQEALVVAKDLARRLHAQLVVHKKDGKFQKV